MCISIVIPFYNDEDVIFPCVNSILKAQLKINKIYIINNSSIQTKIQDIFKKESSVVIVNCKPSIGFGRACNIGAFYAMKDGAEIIIFLNQDTIVYPHSLKELIYPFEENNNISICVPLICSYENINIIEKSYLKMYIAPLHEMISDAIKGFKLKPYYEVKHAISGSCLAIRSKDISNLGLFDPMIWMYGEDVDLFLRYKSQGKKSVIVPSSYVSHAHSHVSSKGRKLDKIKYNIHKNIPYSIFKSQSKSGLIQLKQLLVFILKDYAWALNKLRIKLIIDFILIDITLPLRIFRSLKHRNIEKLKADIMHTLEKDKIQY